MKSTINFVILLSTLNSVPVALAANTYPLFPSPGRTNGNGYVMQDAGFRDERDFITAEGYSIGTFSYTLGSDSHNVGLLWRTGEATVLALDQSHEIGNVYDINSSKTVAGQTTHVSPTGVTYHAALWHHDGSRIDLPSLGSSSTGSESSGAYAISDAGVAYGNSFKYVNGVSQGSRPVKWTTSGQIVELPIPAVDGNNVATGVATNVNRSGVACGYSAAGTSSAGAKAIRWDVDDSATILSMTTTSGVPFVTAAGFHINEQKFIVGQGLTQTAAGGPTYGVLWRPDGTAIELANIPSDSVRLQNVNDLNSHAYAVGTVSVSVGINQTARAVRWTPTGQVLELAGLSEITITKTTIATEINDLGFMAGQQIAPSPNRYAVIWTPDNQVINLNTLHSAGPEWTLRQVYGLSNTGWVTGVARFDPTGSESAYNRGFSMLVPFAGTYGLGDANFDESIDFNDLLIIAQNYGDSTNGSVDVGDFNLDGVTDFNDLLVIAQNYGSQPTFSSAINNANFEADWHYAQSLVPEPTTLGVLTFSLVLLRRKH